MTRNSAVLEDGFWGVGEKLVLCGNDSSVEGIDSSVKVVSMESITPLTTTAFKQALKLP